MPPLPDVFYWIEFTRAVNRYLGSAYTIEQVQTLPGDQLTLIEMLLAVQHGPIETDDLEDF